MTTPEMDHLVAEGPWFEDLKVGQVLPGASAVTLTEGLAAVHASIVGDRMRLGLDRELARRVTGQDRPLATAPLVWDVAIGQSTGATHHVVANLFYRGLSLRRAPCLGDTLRTRTEVVALKQNTRRTGRRATGLAGLRIVTEDQERRPVLDFWRCAMLPLRNQQLDTHQHDDMSLVGSNAALVHETLTSSPWDWELGPARRLYPPSEPTPKPGQEWVVTGGDVVTGAAELARLTLNQARVHHDDTADEAGRLVYGGHTIGLALSQATRALPGLLTVLAWQHCDHLGPVREGDTLSSRVQVEDVRELTSGRLVTLRSLVDGRSGPEDSPQPVLDWQFVALFA